MQDLRINKVSQMRDLGVIFDTKLSFVPHVSFVKTSALRTMYFITRLAYFIRDPTYLTYLYNALVVPRLEYGSCIWSMACKTNICQLDSIGFTTSCLIASISA